MSFYETLSRYYDELFPASAAQVRFVLERTPGGGAVLDVAAGTGNLAIELARAGCRVTATDLDPAMVAKMEAKRALAAGGGSETQQTQANGATSAGSGVTSAGSGVTSAGLGLTSAGSGAASAGFGATSAGRAASATGSGATGRFEPLALDMRDVDRLPQEAFDTVLCVGNSLVHLPTIIDIADAFLRMYDRLKPGGSLIVQTVNYDRILRDRIKNLPLLERRTDDGQMVRFVRSYEMAEDGILFLGELTVEETADEAPGGGQTPGEDASRSGGVFGNSRLQTWRNEVRLLPLQSEELVSIAEQYGLPEPQLYGSFQGEPYSDSSPAMVAVLRKPKP